MPQPSPNNFARKIRPYAIIIATAIIVIWKFGGRFRESYFPAPTTTVSASSKIKHVGSFEMLENCQWINDKGNDGDSFQVKHGKNEYTIRLYYVDAPEKYLSDKYKKQRKRVAEQGEYFGGLSPDQTVEVGLKAKAFTEKQLKGKSFTVLTRWENVFDSERFYGLVWLPGSTEERPMRLSDALIKAGLVRIHTKGPGNQNNAGFSQFEDPEKQQQKRNGYMARLQKMEDAARKQGAGAWGGKN